MMDNSWVSHHQSSRGIKHLLMSNGKILLTFPTLVNNTIHTPANGIRLGNLMQLPILSSVIRPQRTMRTRVRRAILVRTVNSARLWVKGQPTRHGAAGLGRVGQGQIMAIEGECVDIAIVVRCPETGG
jgi:hypothetical protein